MLAAVTEVIKTQGGKETETEYFGALASIDCVSAIIMCRVRAEHAIKSLNWENNLNKLGVSS